MNRKVVLEKQFSKAIDTSKIIPRKHFEDFVRILENFKTSKKCGTAEGLNFKR